MVNLTYIMTEFWAKPGLTEYLSSLMHEKKNFWNNRKKGPVSVGRHAEGWAESFAPLNYPAIQKVVTHVHLLGSDKSFGFGGWLDARAFGEVISKSYLRGRLRIHIRGFPTHSKKRSGCVKYQLTFS